MIKTYFSQNTNQKPIFLLSSKNPRKCLIQGIPLATFLLLLCLVDGPQGAQKHCSTIELPGKSAELKMVLLQYHVVPLKRSEVLYPKPMKLLGISDTLCLFDYLFVYLMLLCLKTNRKKEVERKT